MTLQDSIYRHLGNLPQNLHAEVLDFVLFLEQKYSTPREEAPSEKKCLAEMLTQIPDVGIDEDFERIDESGRVDHVFD